MLCHFPRIDSTDIEVTLLYQLHCNHTPSEGHCVLAEMIENERAYIKSLTFEPSAHG